MSENKETVEHPAKRFLAWVFRSDHIASTLVYFAGCGGALFAVETYGVSFWAICYGWLLGGFAFCVAVLVIGAFADAMLAERAKRQGGRGR